MFTFSWIEPADQTRTRAPNALVQLGHQGYENLHHCINLVVLLSLRLANAQRLRSNRSLIICTPWSALAARQHNLGAPAAAKLLQQA